MIIPWTSLFSFNVLMRSTGAVYPPVPQLTLWIRFMLWIHLFHDRTAVLNVHNTLLVGIIPPFHFSLGLSTTYGQEERWRMETLRRLLPSQHCHLFWPLSTSHYHPHQDVWVLGNFVRPTERWEHISVFNGSDLRRTSLLFCVCRWSWFSAKI